MGKYADAAVADIKRKNSHAGQAIEEIRAKREATEQAQRDRDSVLAALGTGADPQSAGLPAPYPGLSKEMAKTLPYGSLTPNDVALGRGAPQPFTVGTEQQVRDRKQDRVNSMEEDRAALEMLEGEYGILANDALPEEQRAQYQAQYDSLREKYGEDITAEKLYDIIEQEQSALDAEQDAVLTEANTAKINSLSEEEYRALTNYAASRRGGIDEVPAWLMRRQKDVAALIEKYGRETVDSMAETWERMDNRRAAEAQAAAAEAAGEQLGFGAIPFSVAGGIVGGVQNLGGIVRERVQGTGGYSTDDPYHAGSELSHMAQNLNTGAVKKAPEQLFNFLELAGQAVNPYADQGAVANYRPTFYEGTEGTKTRDVLDAVGSGAYQVTNTAADTIARAYLGGGLFGAGTTGAKVASLGLAGVKSFGDTYNDVSAKGGTPGQAMVLGIFNGGTEIATEYIPLDEWWKIAKNGSGSVADALKAAARQGAMEMPQEEIGFLATTMAEYAVLREKSEYQVLLKELTDSGIPREEAERMVWEEFGRQAAGVAATSFFSGALSEAGAEAFHALMPGAVTQEQTAQTGQAPQTAQTQQTQTQETASAAEIVSEPQTPLQKAQENYRQNSTVSNSQAEAILADSEAVAVLQREAGLELGGTKAQDRAAVKAAVARLTGPAEAGRNAATDIAESIASDFAEDGAQAAQAAQEPQGDVDAAVGTALRGETYQRPQTAQEQAQTRPAAAQNAERTETQADTEHGAVGAAERGFTLKSAMIDAYGEIPEGENPVRPDQLPRSTDGIDRVSYTARTALEAEATPAEFVPLIENNTMRGQFSFIPITNSETVRRATETIRADGWTAALTDWTAAVRQGQAGADVTAMGALLYNNAVNSGDFRQALDILTDYQLAVRNSAQALQAARILKTLTPSDRLYCIRRSIRRMVDDLGLDADIQIDEDLARQYQEAGTNEEADEILDLIVQDVARQIPPTLGERITALRYLNMLGNFRTQIRNIVGNIGAQLTYLAKDEIGAAFEQMASWVNPNFDRTKSFITDRETRRAAADDYENVAEWISNGGRYNDAGDVGGGFAQRVQDARRILPPGLEQYRRATNWAMNNQYFGDAAFGRMAYARALAGYLNARGIHTNDLGTVDQETLAAAREYAVRQAQEATFRDNNEVSTWVSRAMRGRNNPTWARVLGDAIMPFRRTPANVLVRAEEFSPLGLINSAVNTVRAARGRISGAELIESWAKSVTGTGLFVLGYALANMGFLRGGPSDDEDERTMDDLVGYQDYALILPDGTNMTIDFFSPAAVPALLGAQLSEVLADGGITWDEIDDVVLSMADPMVDMSMLQGLNDLFENLRYSDMPLGQIFADAALSYVTQALGNTLMGQLERSTEQNRMTTYVDKGSQTPEWLQRALGKLSQKVPGWDYQQTEYIDRWGRTEENPKGIANFVYQLFSPAYFDKAEVDELAAEIYRLNDAQSDVSVVPRAADKKLTFTEENGTVHKDYTLSKEEYDTLARVQGQTAKELLTEIVGSDAYAAMTDTQKAEVFSMVYDYAREKARDEAVEGYVPNYSDWMKALAEDGVSSIYRRAATTDISGGLTDWWTAENAADRESGLEELRGGLAVYDGLSAADKAKTVNEATGRTKYLLLAHDKGMSTDKFLAAYEQHQRYDDMDISASDKAEKWAIYLQSQREKGIITEAQETVLRENMQFYSQFPGKAEKVDLLRESGLSSSEIYDVTHGIDLLRPIEGNTDVTPYQKYEVIAGSGLSDAETDAVMLAYMPDYDPDKKGSDRTELKYQDIRDRGYSPEEYVDLYGVYRDGGGKWAIINAINALPYVKSYQEAVLLYSIFEGGYYK